MAEEFKIEKGELAGFGLAGWKQPSGVIKICGTNRFINEWPQEIYMLGNTYTLEDVIKGNVDEATGEQHEYVEYV